MAEGTKIEWTHRPGTIPATMNALVGCQKVSAGCANCYAIEVAHIRAGNPLPVLQEKFAGTTKVAGGKRIWTGKVTLSEKALLDPLSRKAPRTYFVNALSDLFFEGVTDEWVDRHFAVFALCPQHTFIVLTKRPERMLAYFNSAAYANVQLRACDIVTEWLDTTSDPRWFQRVERQPVIITFAPEGRTVRAEFPWPLPNVWLGVSVEDQATADERIPLLLRTPAAVRFISAEPLLGAVNDIACYLSDLGVGVQMMHGVDWVICGGESGPNARPMDPKWARGLRDQCVAAGVPFFFKQWGEFAPSGCPPVVADAKYAAAGKRMPTSVFFPNTPDPKLLNGGKLCDRHIRQALIGRDGQTMYRFGKKLAGHLLDGKEWHQFPIQEACRG